MYLFHLFFIYAITEPFAKYDMHRQRQQKLIARVKALRELTNDAFTQNAKQLDAKARELNHITDAAVALRNHLMSDEDDTEMAVENEQMENPDAK
jgi:hypothetical protein